MNIISKWLAGRHQRKLERAYEQGRKAGRKARERLIKDHNLAYGPFDVVGWGPFALPGERKRLREAEAARVAKIQDARIQVHPNR